MAEIDRHIRKRIGAGIPRLGQQRGDGVAQVALVLGLGLVGLGGDFGNLGGGVVAGAQQLDQLEGLRGAEGEVRGVEFDDDFFRRRVCFAEVGGVAEAEGGRCGWGGEGLG